MEQIFLGVMELQEAKNHQYALQAKGVALTLKVNDQTCTSGCKVTVEVWAQGTDEAVIKQHFQSDYLKHVKGHEPDINLLSAVFDTGLEMVICQACGFKFAPNASEYPDCGLVYL
jgi:hypothetical protein